VLWTVLLQLRCNWPQTEWSTYGAPASAPSVAFFVFANRNTDITDIAWATENDDIHIFVPKQKCTHSEQKCDKSPRPLAARKKASSGWWCAQRQYINGLRDMLAQSPNASFYMLVDEDTVVFRKPLDRLVSLLDHDILSPEEHLYLGHLYHEPTDKFKGLPIFAMSGGGVLIRGSTMHRALQNLRRMAHKQNGGTHCWWHCDWALAEAFRQSGVSATNFQGFQQFATHKKGSCRPERDVACHTVKGRRNQAKMIAEHNQAYLERDLLKDMDVGWATPVRSQDCNLPANLIVSGKGCI